MPVPVVDLANFPIFTRGPFSPDASAAVKDLRICQAVGEALGLSDGIRLVSCLLDDRNDFSKAYLNIITSERDGLTEYRIRINGIVKRAGIECLAVSLVGLSGEKVIAYSEDLVATPSKCGLLLFADAKGEALAVNDAIRALVGVKKPAATAKAKKPTSTPKPTLKDSLFVADSRIRRVHVSPDGRWIATTHNSQNLVLWDVATGKPNWSKRCGGDGLKFVQGAAFSPGSNAVASGATTVKIFSVPDGDLLTCPEGHPKGELVRLVWTPEALVTVSSLSVVGKDNSIAFWDGTTGRLLKKWKWELPERVAFKPGDCGVIFASGFRNDRESDVLCRIDVATGKVLASVKTESAWFAVNQHGVWLDTEAGLSVLDDQTLKQRKLVPVQGSVLAVSQSSIYLSEGMRVARLDLNGKVVAGWEVPEVPGIREHVAALDAAGKATGIVDYDELTELSLCVFPDEDRVVVSTALSLSVWTADGSPLRMPSI